MSQERSHDDVRLDAFFASLPLARRALLILDYDGTLAPFTPERDRATPYPGVRGILNQIIATGRTQVVVVTGRAAATLQPLLGLRHPVEVWGSHGAERLHADGSYLPAALPPAAQAGLEQAWEWLQQQTRPTQGERKPTALALHWRGIAEADALALRQAAEQAWGEIARNSELLLHPFDGGLELRAAGFDKGRAVRTLLAEAGSGVVAAFLGDDLTDEHAFAALRGQGLTILVRPEFRPTAAELWLCPPEELLAFLRRWHAATSTPADSDLVGEE